MEIKNNRIYHLPTEELRKDFLTKCEEKGIKWVNGDSSTDMTGVIDHGSEFCIKVEKLTLAAGSRSWYASHYKSFPFTVWEIEKPQFKVGDKVRVIKSAWKRAEERNGKEGVVTEIMRNNAVTVKLGTDTEDWFYPNANLELMPEEPKSKPTIIKLPNNHKIVINKPYTIYTDGKVTGKAKCNPEDEWSTEEGIRLAVERYKKNRVSPLTKSASDFYARELLKTIIRSPKSFIHG